jgi:hypothetical protein
MGVGRISLSDSEELIKVNELVLRDVRVRKADRPQVLSRARLDRILTEVREVEGDAYARGNRRTAFVATRLFLEPNGETMKVDHDPRILLGVREGFCTTLEVKSWLKGNAFKRFARGQG